MSFLCTRRIQYFAIWKTYTFNGLLETGSNRESTCAARENALPREVADSPRNFGSGFAIQQGLGAGFKNELNCLIQSIELLSITLLMLLSKSFVLIHVAWSSQRANYFLLQRSVDKKKIIIIPYL